MRRDFYERYKAGRSEKYPNYENLLHHCYDQVRVVLQMCLQTISSVISSDGLLKPIGACKFNLGSLHIIMNTVITL